MAGPALNANQSMCFFGFSNAFGTNRCVHFVRGSVCSKQSDNNNFKSSTAPTPQTAKSRDGMMSWHDGMHDGKHTLWFPKRKYFAPPQQAALSLAVACFS